MKVAIVVNELNIKGGTHKQVLRLCQYLKKQFIDFVVVTRCFESSKTYSDFSDFDIRYLYETMPKWYAGTTVLAKLNKFIKRIKSDRQLYSLIPDDCTIINIHDNWLDALIKFSKKDNKNVVWQINDLPPHFNLGTSSNTNDNMLKRIKRFLTCNNIKDVDIITVNVTKNAERVKKCFDKNAQVLYCGVDVNKSLEKHSYKENAKDFRLLSMGVFFPYRNYETLVEAVKTLKNEQFNIKLDLVGNTEWDKEYANEILSLIKAYHLEESITVWGQVDDDEYIRLFNEADAFAFVNIEQSFGLVVFEAMSAGLPTIVSNSVGAVELLHDDKDSIFVDPCNVSEICEVIRQLKNHAGYYDRIALEAYEAVKDFTWDSLYSSRMLEIFEGLEGKCNI